MEEQKNPFADFLGGKSNETKPEETKAPETTNQESSESNPEPDVVLSDRDAYLEAVSLAEGILDGRSISDVALGDPYWAARDKATELYNKVKK